MTTKQTLYIGKLFIDVHGETLEYMSNGLAFRDTKVSVVTTDNSPAHIASRMAVFINCNLLEPNRATCRYLSTEVQESLRKTAGVLYAFDPKSLDNEIVRYSFTGVSIEWSIVGLEGGSNFDLVLR
jgi:hypothetical protein